MIHPTAIIHPTAVIGSGTRIWAYVQIGEYARIGKDGVIGNGAYIDRHVVIGDRVRVHNKALLYHGLVVEDDVFIGPGSCFTNDPRPRSGMTRDMSGCKWLVKRFASIGANATVLPDVSIGSYAMIGAGSVVTRDVADHVLCYGNPARPKGLVCGCLSVYKDGDIAEEKESFSCPKCGRTFDFHLISGRGSRA